MKYKIYLVSSVYIAAFALCTLLTAQTTPRPTSSPSASVHQNASPAAASPAKQSTRSNRFHGMISAVDQNARTFTISGKKKSRVFKVTGKTIIARDGYAASMEDITENEEASGSYWKDADGTVEAKTVKLGPMSAGEKAKEGTKKGKSSPAPATSATASPGLKP